MRVVSVETHRPLRNVVGQWLGRLTYNEGDDEVDLVADTLHIPLPQETGQADLGALCKNQKPCVLSVSCSSMTMRHRSPGQTPQVMQLWQYNKSAVHKCYPHIEAVAEYFFLNKTFALTQLSLTKADITPHKGHKTTFLCSIWKLPWKTIWPHCPL